MRVMPVTAVLVALAAALVVGRLMPGGRLPRRETELVILRVALAEIPPHVQGFIRTTAGERERKSLGFEIDDGEVESEAGLVEPKRIPEEVHVIRRGITGQHRDHERRTKSNRRSDHSVADSAQPFLFRRFEKLFKRRQNIFRHCP